MKLSVVKIISFLFSIILIVIIAASILTYKRAQAVQETEKLVQHTQKILFESGEVLSNMQDIVLSTRGFVITGDSVFLHPFIIATNQIDHHVENISLLTKDNSVQQHRIDTLKKLIDERIELSVQIIQLKKLKGFEASQQLSTAQQGKFFMDEIRTLLKTIQTEEKKLLTLHEEAYANKTAEFNLLFYLLFGSLLSLLIVGFFIIRYNLVKRKKGEILLKKSEELFSSLFDHNPGSIVISEFESTKLINCNEAFVKFFGFKTKEEVIGKASDELNIGIDTEQKKEIRQLLIENKGLKNYELKLQNKQGETKWVSSSIELLEIDKIVCIISVFIDVTEQKNAEEKLKEFNQSLEKQVQNKTAELMKAELHYKSILDDLMEGATIIGFDWQYKYLNSTALKQTGYSREELLGYTIMEKYPGVEQTKTYDDIKRCLIERIVIKNEIEFDFQNGKTGCFDVRYQPIPEGVFIISIDISERKQAEEEIKQLTESLEQKVIERTLELGAITEKLNEAQAIANIGNWEVNAFTGENKWSDELYRILGFTKREVTPSVELLLSIIHPEDIDFVKQKADEVLNGFKSENFGYRIKGSDGTIRHLYGQSKVEVDEEGKPVRIFGILQDITEQKNIENELVLIAEKLNEAQKFAHIGNWEFDLITGKTIWSESLYEIYGLKPFEIEPTFEYFKSRIHPDDLHLIDEAFPKLLENQPIEIELRILFENDEFKWFSNKIKPVFHENQLILLLGINQDITESKKIMEELGIAKALAEDANRMKSEFLANMSHEIRTPLNAIVGFSSILKEKAVGQPIYTEYLTNIIQSSEVLLSLINDILDLSKVEAGKMVIDNRPVNLTSIIKEIESVFHIKITEKGIYLTIKISNAIPGSLITDEKYLRQILFNIIGNAVKYTHNGGIDINVNIIPKNVEGSKVDLKFSIKDTGIGIHTDQLTSIFEPFVQAKHNTKNIYGGTGLGLSITKRLVELMGGKISVESEYGKGSEFTILLYDIEIASLHEDKNVEIENRVLTDIRFFNPMVLLAEDVLSNRQIIKAFLEPLNITIIETENGEECIDAIHKKRPDLILMDMQMPVMDGYTAISILKSDEALKDIPIIALTASGMKQQKDSFENIADSFLLKPIYKNDLLEQLIKYLPYEKLSVTNDSSIENVDSKPLKAENYKLPPEIKKEMVKTFVPVILKLQETLNIDKIKDFVTQLEEFIKKQKVAEIDRYCRLLKEYTQTFNMDKIQMVLKELVEFINK